METGQYDYYERAYSNGHNAACNERESCDASNKFIVLLDLDKSGLDEVQRKADKLKATLIEIQELIREVDVLTDAIKNRPCWSGVRVG